MKRITLKYVKRVHIVRAAIYSAPTVKTELAALGCDTTCPLTYHIHSFVPLLSCMRKALLVSLMLQMRKIIFNEVKSLFQGYSTCTRFQENSTHNKSPRLY